MTCVTNLPPDDSLDVVLCTCFRHYIPKTALERIHGPALVVFANRLDSLHQEAHLIARRIFYQSVRPYARKQSYEVGHHAQVRYEHT